MASQPVQVDGPLWPRRLLERGLRSNPDSIALVSADSSFSWRDLDAASSRLADSYGKLGLRAGDRVASLMPNRAELLIHYFACFKAGLTAAPLNYRYTPREIDHALTVSEASILVAFSERDADVAASVAVKSLPLEVVHLGSRNAMHRNLEQLIADGSPDGEWADPNPDAPALLLFTSGSTGLPKGVTHSFRTLGWIITGTLLGLECRGDDVMLAASSLSHLGGICFAFSALAAGARALVPHSVEGDVLLPLFRTQKPTVLWMLPAALFRLVRDHGAHSEDFASLRLCISGGDKVSPELEREFQTLTGLPIDEAYGMTEMGTATINPPSGVNKIGSVGQPCPNYEVSIRDDEGKELPRGVEGRLWVRSPAITIGYWANPEATASTIRDGWLDTGDIMMRDDDGYLWFRGRKKQIIIHDGSNICPQEIEETLLEHPAVENAGVIGVHDLVHGENVRAYVSLKAGVATPTEADLIAFAKARVGYKAPEQIVFLREVPHTAVGKIDRPMLKQMAETELNRRG